MNLAENSGLEPVPHGRAQVHPGLGPVVVRLVVELVEDVLERDEDPEPELEVVPATKIEDRERLGPGLEARVVGGQPGLAADIAQVGLGPPAGTLVSNARR